MNKVLAVFCCIFSSLLLLCACGGGAASSAPPAPASSAEPASSAPPAASAPASESAAPTAADVDLAPHMDALMAAAGFLGNAISVSEIDLKAGGVPVADVVQFTGNSSKTYSMDAGVVILLQAASGKAADVAASMAGYQEFTMGNGDYTEFAEAQERTGEARILTFGDIVVYAVSATGDWDALDAAIQNEFA